MQSKAIKILKTIKAPSAIGPYSQGTRLGNIVFTSGQIGMDMEGQLVSEEVEVQAEQAMQNVKSVLECGGASMKSVLKTTVFLTVSLLIQSMADYPKINPIYAKFFEDSEILPARSCVAVAELPKGGELFSNQRKLKLKPWQLLKSESNFYSKYRSSLKISLYF